VIESLWSSLIHMLNCRAVLAIQITMECFDLVKHLIVTTLLRNTWKVEGSYPHILFSEL
jgi:hypothetical protein